MTTFSIQIGAPEDSQPASKPEHAKWEAQPATSQEPTDPRPAGPVVRDPAERGGAVVFKNGEASIVPLQRATAQMKETGGDALDRARNQAGYPVSRTNLTLDDIVDYHGDTRVRELVAMKVLESDPAGGFRWTPQPDAQQSQQTEQQAPPMERLSDKAERAISAVSEKLGDSVMFGLMDAVMEGKEQALANMLPSYASRLGLESDQMNRMVRGVTQEFSEQARATLGMDPETFQAFADDAWSKNPDAIRKAITAQVQNGNLGPLKQLGAAFTASGAAYDDASLLEAEVPAGARVWRDSLSGKVMVSQNGITSTLRQAIASGEARVSRRK